MMQVEAFMYFPNSKKIIGETQDVEMKKKGAFQIHQYEFGAETHVNIGSISAGGGAGKASFNGLNIVKTTDTSSAELFQRLCTGAPISDATIEVRRYGGSGINSANTFFKLELKLIFVQEMTWGGSDGDHSLLETLTLQYGAMKTTYSRMKNGHMKKHSSAMWSSVKNKAEFAV